MIKKSILFCSLWSWSHLVYGHDQWMKDIRYDPFVPAQSDLASLQHLQNEKMATVQGALKSESLTQSVYFSALQDLDLAFDTLKTTHDLIKETLQHLKPLEVQRSSPSPEQVEQESSQQLERLIQNLGTFTEQPSLSYPFAFNLKEIPDYFTGHLEKIKCTGLFSGVVQKAEAQLEDRSWIFSMTLGHQDFSGKLTLKEGVCPNFLTLTSKNFVDHQISFQINPHLADHWQDEPSMKKAWAQLLGLSNGDQPATIYAPSHILPQGITVDVFPTIPTAMYYQPVIDNLEPAQPANTLWARFCQWLSGGPQPIKSFHGMFQIVDGRYQTTGKVINSEIMKQPWQITTYGGATITIQPTFDYQQSWDVPVILWSRYQLKMTPSYHFMQSRFDDSLNQEIYPFDTKPLYQDLEAIFFGYLASPKNQEDLAKAVQSLGQLNHNLEGKLAFLDTRRVDLLKAIEANKRSLATTYQEGQWLLTKVS